MVSLWLLLLEDKRRWRRMRFSSRWQGNSNAVGELKLGNSNVVGELKCGGGTQM